MKKIWTVAAVVCAALTLSCSSPEDKATDFAKELKEVVEEGKSKKVDGVLKARKEYEGVLSADKLDQYSAAWVAAVEQEATDKAIAVIKAVKSCDVATAQELEKKISAYKKALYDCEIAKFDEAFAKRINGPEDGLKKEDMEKFNEAVYVWFHPLEKLVVIEEKPVEVPVEASVEVPAAI